MRGELIAFDLETTGLDPSRDEIIEVGLARFRDGEVVERYQSLVKPTLPIPDDITHLTGIHQEDVDDAPSMDEIKDDLRAFFGDTTVIAHNVSFDRSFLRKHDLLARNDAIDTFELASIVLPSAPRYSLGSLVALIGVELERAHRALDDAVATGHLYWRLWQRLCALPSSILAEIIHAGEGIKWTLRAVFEAALDQSIRDSVPQRPALPFTAERLASPALSLENARHGPLEPRAVDGVFGVEGKLAAGFGDYEVRDEQMRMAREVTLALNRGEHLMIEAGTGTGKSLAYLVPAALWALQNDQRVTVSTNTINLQQQLLNNDIPQARRIVGERLEAALMKGRGNYLCPRRLQTLRRRKPANPDELRTLAKLLVWLQASDSGDRGEITLRAGEWRVWSRLSARDEGCSTMRCASEMDGICPYYRARQRAERAHIVITNHALLIADARVDNRALPDYNNLIVDEAHHLEDAITDGMTRRIDQAQIYSRLRDLGNGRSGVLGELLDRGRSYMPPDEAGRLSAFINSIDETVELMKRFIRQYFRALHDFASSRRATNRYAMRLLNSHRDAGEFAAVLAAWKYLGAYLLAVTDAVERLCDALPRYARYDLPDFGDFSSEIRGHRRYLADLHEQLESFTQAPDSGAVYSFTGGEQADRLELQIAPLHVGPMMEEYLNHRLESIILTSATLQTQDNFDHIKERLFAEDYKAVAVGSPFDYKRSTLVYIPQDIPEPKQQFDYQRMVGRGVVELATALDGRMLVLFTSYALLRQVSKAITPRLNLGQINVYDQSFGASRDALLESFLKSDRAVLMGTRSFWEGVDIPGDDLSAVVITKLPFAVPSDPVFAARSETYANSFQQYAVPDAILRFRQGFGRLIRRRTDRGVVAIFDSRVMHKAYGKSFLESLPECTVQYGTLDKLPAAASRWIMQG